MDNASNALLLAGGMLIALIVLSIGVMLFSHYTQIGESYEQSQQFKSLEKFNEHFTRFAERTNITAQEIITLANFAKDYNKELDANIITVQVGATNYAEKDLDDKRGTDFIKDNSVNNVTGTYKYYTCGSIEDFEKDPNTGRITKIVFNAS